MKNDFDHVYSRRNTASVKWDLAEKLFGSEDVLPMWVADMDFPAPRAVIDALEARARHGIFGYTACMPAYYDAVVQWMNSRHGWRIKPGWICFSPGVIPALNMLVQAFSEPGDGILIQTPVYYPFMDAIKGNGRIVLDSPLILNGSRYQMDFDDLARKACRFKPPLMILCSPHNPVGRVWSSDELSRLAEICLENDTVIAADEIHADLTFKGFKHTPLASVSAPALARSITCTSPSKTFNLAGLQASNLVIADPKLRSTYLAALKRNGLIGPNAFAADAVQAAYRHGGPWLEDLLKYLEGNLRFLMTFIRERLPGIRIIDPEATYLVWMDCRGLGLKPAALRDLFVKKAKVGLEDGTIFGKKQGAGFQRINIACPRSVLAQGLQRIEGALKRS